MAAADFRLYHSRLYFVQLQAAQSWTDSVGKNHDGSLLQADWDRTGRRWGFHYTLRGVEPGFNAAAGFVNRTGLVETRTFNRFSFYGARDALVQTYGAFVQVARAWDYASGRPLIESGENISPSATLRGGWQLSGAVGRNGFAYDPASYQDLTIVTYSGALTRRAHACRRSAGPQTGPRSPPTPPTGRRRPGNRGTAGSRRPAWQPCPPTPFAHHTMRR